MPKMSLLIAVDRGDAGKSITVVGRSGAKGWKMGAGKSLLIEISHAVGLDDEAALIKALGDLGRKWIENAGQVDGFSSAVALIRAVADGVSDQHVTDAFAKLGAEDELAQLQKGADKLKALLDSIPETVVKLLEPIGTYDESSGSADIGVLSWPLLDKQASASGGGQDSAKPSYALSLGANAALTIEAGDSWPYSDPMPGPLLRMRAEGGLKPKADATLPFSVGSVTASASGSAHCALEYYFAVADQRKLYALAVGERLPALADPFDFDSVWDSFARSDLAGLHYEFEGDVEATVAVAIADSAALGALGKMDLGATVSVGVKLGGKFYLTFRRGSNAANGEPRIIAALSRQRSKGVDLGAKLGVTVDLAGLATRVRAVLTRALGEWETVLAEIKPYLSPGTWLQNKAGSLIEKEAAELIKDEAVRAALVRDLQGVVGIGDPEDSALLEWLTEQLTGAIDSAQGWASNQAAGVLSATNVLGRNLPAFAQPDIKPKLQASADKLLGKAADELKKQVDSLFAGKRAELGKALQRIGAAADDKVKDADAALKSVRALIDRFDNLFRKVVAEAENSARAKISAAIQIEESRLSSATLELAGTFLARSDQARQIFRSLTRGDFRSLVRLVEAGGSADFALDASQTSLTRYASSKSGLGMELVLFGFGITGNALLSAEASVRVDGAGTVYVDTEGKFRSTFDGRDADREIEIVSSFSLVAARALQAGGAPPSADRAIGLAVTMGHIDSSLKRKEVERFIDSLVRSGMVGPQALARAQATFTKWAGTPGSNGKISGALLLKLALDRPSLAPLLGLDVLPSPGALPDASRRQIVRTAFDALRRSSSSNRIALDATTAFLAREHPNRTLDDLLADPNRTRRSLTFRMGTGAPQLASEHEPFYDASVLSQGLYEMIERLREIYFSTPETVSDNSPATWGPKDYRDAQRRAVKAVQGWLQLNSVLFWTNSEVHPRTIAFVDALARLGRIDLGQKLSLVMWRKDIDPETVVLSPSES